MVKESVFASQLILHEVLPHFAQVAAVFAVRFGEEKQFLIALQDENKAIINIIARENLSSVFICLGLKITFAKKNRGV
jgi:hypothetical protein